MSSQKGRSILNDEPLHVLTQKLKGQIVNILLKLRNSGLKSDCYLGKVNLNLISVSILLSSDIAMHCPSING